MNTGVQALQREIAEWADEVFPDRTAHDALCKLMLEEIPEFAMNQDDPGEYADLVILILDIAHLRGIDVAKAVHEKMDVNRKRNWKLDPKTRMMKHEET